MHAWSASKDLFATRRKHRLERFDTVVSRFQKEVLYHGLRTLELSDQHLCVRAARHLAAHFGHHTVAAGAVQNDNDAPFPRLHEIRGFGTLMLGDPWRTSTSSPFPSCHSFGYLPESRSKNTR
jgi:hypothetical protein